MERVIERFLLVLDQNREGPVVIGKNVCILSREEQMANTFLKHEKVTALFSFSFSALEPIKSSENIFNQWFWWILLSPSK